MGCREIFARIQGSTRPILGSDCAACGATNGPNRKRERASTFIRSIVFRSPFELCADRTRFHVCNRTHARFRLSNGNIRGIYIRAQKRSNRLTGNNFQLLALFNRCQRAFFKWTDFFPPFVSTLLFPSEKAIFHRVILKYTVKKY